MSKKIFLVLAFLCTLILRAQDNAAPIALDLQKNQEIDVSENKGTYSINTLGKTPVVFSRMLKHNLPSTNDHLAFEYFCPTGIDLLKISFFSKDNKVVSTKSVSDIGSTEGWVTFKVEILEALNTWGKKGDYISFQFGTAPDLKIEVRNLKIRPLTTREKEIKEKVAIQKKEEKILENNLVSYLNKSFPNNISQVIVGENTIAVKGSTTGEQELYLAEVPVYTNVTELKTFPLLKPLPKTTTFNVHVDRFADRNSQKEDRVLSKWVLVSKKGKSYQINSHARYADSIVPKFRYDFVKPSTKKGLGGYSANREAPPSDLDDLGITSVTVNIWLNGLFRSSPSAENIPFSYLGNTYYINRKQLEEYDKTFQSTFERNIEVSAILLVAKATESEDKKIGEILQHPDTDPAGIYAMPNVTSSEGVQYYAAILDFLAQRYTLPDAPFGRIHHWIIHNEVDAGWVWTNAGDKSAWVFMDLYYKSMRMVYNIARKYNANSKVFISLTHYWNWTSNPHFYHSKDLLEKLLAFSYAEGDFEWAIAHHPYPEDLREPKTWLDKKVQFNFETPLITFKNTEVLDAWVQQPKVLYKGKKRTVYLSENGTNSPTYSEKDLTEQAAGMAYALKKLNYLDGIDGIQYHNWQDNRGEGGLRLGLRRFPDAAENPSGKKPVWEVYAAFGTSKEDEVFDPYKKVIGITSWDEIKNTEEIKKKSP